MVKGTPYAIYEFQKIIVCPYKYTKCSKDILLTIVDSEEVYDCGAEAYEKYLNL